MAIDPKDLPKEIRDELGIDEHGNRRPALFEFHEEADRALRSLAEMLVPQARIALVVYTDRPEEDIVLLSTAANIDGAIAALNRSRPRRETTLEDLEEILREDPGVARLRVEETGDDDRPSSD